MKQLTSFVLVFSVAGCGAASSMDASVEVDAGRDGGVDAGVVCEGVPARLSSAMCVAFETVRSVCAATASAALMRTNVSCDAGPGILGYLAEGACPDGLVSVSWVYGFPGDTYECFFGEDGGTLVGLINYSDRGPLLAGRVAECTPQPAPACR